MKKYLIIALVLLITLCIIGLSSPARKENVIEIEEVNTNYKLSYTFENKHTSVPIETYMNGLGTSYITTSIECNEGTVASITRKGVVTFTTMAMPVLCNVNFENWIPTLAEQVLADNPTVLTVGGSAINGVTPRSSFNDGDNKTYTNTIYQTNNAEQGETVHYYAGNVTNNWVIFGTCKDSTYNCTLGDDLYWRIIRINEESTGGGVRLLYSGSGSRTVDNHKAIATTTNGYIKTGAYNSGTDSTHNDRFVGYMYGTSGYEHTNIRENTQSSTIKGVTDAWYGATFTETSLESMISTTAVYCNDRSYTSATWYSSGSSYNYFGANGRNASSKAPSYACGANTDGYGYYFSWGGTIWDKFSAEETTYGNGKLSNPVALMTVDEVVFAGGKVNAALTSPYAWYFLNAAGNFVAGDLWWWTMSPVNANSSGANVFGVIVYSDPGNLYGNNVTTSGNGIRPVISLKDDTMWLSGDGTADNPYRVENYEAQYNGNTYTIIYNGNGNDGGSTASSNHTYGTVKALTTNGFTKTDYVFNGWNTKADGSGTSYSDGQSVLNLTSTNNGSVTLYAQWRQAGYTITFDVNGGNSWTSTRCTSPRVLSGTTCTMVVEQGNSYGSLPTPTRSSTSCYDYSFNYWRTSSGTRVYTSTVPTENTTLYAVWSDSYTCCTPTYSCTGGYTYLNGTCYKVDDSLRNKTTTGTYSSFSACKSAISSCSSCECVSTTSSTWAARRPANSCSGGASWENSHCVLYDSSRVTSSCS